MFEYVQKKENEYKTRGNKIQNKHKIEIIKCQQQQRKKIHKKCSRTKNKRIQ